MSGEEQIEERAVVTYDMIQERLGVSGNRVRYAIQKHGPKSRIPNHARWFESDMDEITKSVRAIGPGGSPRKNNGRGVFSALVSVVVSERTLAGLILAATDANLKRPEFIRRELDAIADRALSGVGHSTNPQRDPLVLV